MSTTPAVGAVPAEGLLLVGHGSRSDEGAAEMLAIARLVGAALPEVAVDVGFLEMTDPPAGPVLDRLAAAGCGRVVVLPVVLLGAGHAKSDVPAVVLEGRRRHPDLHVHFGSPLGISRDLVGLLGGALTAAGGQGLPLLLVARGTSDPDANGDAHKVTRLLGEWVGAPFVHTAFTGVTTPLVPAGLEVFARLGYRRLAVAFWFLCTGVLVERARAEIAAFSAATGVEVVDAGHLGPDPRVVPAILERYEEAVRGIPAVNCDLCAYRAPWPGREGRLGQPIGVGHSHLAADHRGH
ncbi:MAG: sirohydrochlorin cobaltochelatase [Actinomycetota bacterium]|nr:sirohydrochlorin cobaltochelatase [Actinomycetota bacterium]